MSKVCTTLPFFLLLCLTSCLGQNLSLLEKTAFTDTLITHLKENYVLQDSVENIVPQLMNRQATKEFTKEQCHKEFAMYLTESLREITRDAHFGFLYNPQLSHLLNGPPGRNTDALNQQLNTIGGGRSWPISKENFFFKKAEILDGNIGYLKLVLIPQIEEAKAMLNAAMTFLSNTDLFILDLRGNRGGAGGFIPYLMSYFFPKEKILLYRREMPAPAWDSVSYHYTFTELPGKRMDDLPLYILTDQGTGSAATNLAYKMQSFGKAKIVGENTGSGYRGAHSAGLYSLPNGFVGLIPIGKVVNAKTNTNWRYQGVQPDILTESSQALNEAYLYALEKLIEVQTDKTIKADLVRIFESNSAPNDKTPSDRQAIGLDRYVGNFEGGRTIWAEGNQLKYIREGGSALNLQLNKEHLFQTTLPSGDTTNQVLPGVQFSLGPGGKAEYILLVFDERRDPIGPYKKLIN